MKKSVLTLITVAFLGSITIISCGGETKTQSEQDVAATQYYCPMKCEGDKTYAEKGSCPKCGMDLVEVE